MAAAMLGSTAVFADQAKLEVQYVAKDKIQATVGASAEDDQATILAFQNGAALESVVSGDLAYIGQDQANDTGIGLEVGQPAKAVFEFNTAGPANRTSTGKIKIYAAGSVNTLSAEKEVYEQAPISKIEFEEGITLTLKDNATQEDIRDALAGKSLTVTHTLAEGTDTSTIAIDGTADKDFTYEIATGTSGSYLKATYTPADGSKFGVVSGDSLASLEADSPAVTVESGVDYTYSLKDDGKLTYGVDETVTADALKAAVAGLITATPPEGFTVDESKVELFDEAGTNPVTFENAVLAINGASDGTNLSYTVKYDGEATTNKLTIEIKQRTVTSVSLAADKTDITLPFGTTEEQIVNELKTGKYVKLTATVNYDSGNPATKDVTASATYAAPTGEGPYTVSVTYGEGGQTSAAVVLNVSISTEQTKLITGTVQAAGEAAQGAVVIAYDQATGAFAGAAATDAAGAFEVEVANDGTYTLMVTWTPSGWDDGFYNRYFTRVQVDDVAVGAVADPIQLVETAGDVNGDGKVDANDYSDLTGNYGTDFTAAQ